MREKRWMHILLAAALIVVAGGVIALAETVDVEVEVDGEASTTVEVRTDDSIDVFTLDDLADGEERVVQAGEHTITVRRTGDEITVLMDEITVLMDGEALGGSDGAMIQKMIRIGDPTDGDEKMIIMVGGHHRHKFIECDTDGEGVKIGKVRYRCEETGSVLLVDPEHASQDSLVDPASGCVMTKVVEERPKVIIIKKEIRVVDED